MLYALEAMRTPVICFLLTLSSQMLPAATGYLVHNLVADDKSVATADFYDPRLINPWGNVASATSPLWAYAGPGAGFAVLSSFWTLFVAFLYSAYAFLTWPFRHLFRWLRRRKAYGKALI